jgi:ribosomal protein S18 acetylase RimI-like enzyme
MISDPTLVLRAAIPEDAGFLWLMLTHAASMSSAGDETAVDAAMSDENLRTYVEHWGRRSGDLGVVALRNGVAPVGAAWIRLGASASPFKVGDAEVPELATAVLPSERGQGVGSAMLGRLVELAHGRYPSIMLSVREANPAVRFYERLGFLVERSIQNRVGGTSLVMRLDLDVESLSQLTNKQPPVVRSRDRG